MEPVYFLNAFKIGLDIYSQFGTIKSTLLVAYYWII